MILPSLLQSEGEGVKELFLSRGLSAHKLNVVNQMSVRVYRTELFSLKCRGVFCNIRREQTCT